MQETEVGLKGGEVRVRGGQCGPQEWIVVGEEREEDAEEEGCGCGVCGG
jgi:hypothetical protein